MGGFGFGDFGVSTKTRATVDNQRSIWESIAGTVSNTILGAIQLIRTPKSLFHNPATTGSGGSASGSAAAPPSSGIDTGTAVAIGAGLLGFGIILAISMRSASRR